MTDLDKVNGVDALEVLTVSEEDYKKKMAELNKKKEEEKLPM